MRERELYQQIIEYLTLRGCYVWRNSTGGRGRYRFGKKGAADILGVASWGQAIAIECKSEKGKLSQEQIEFLDELRNRGAIVIVARYLENVIVEYNEVIERRGNGKIEV